MPPVFHATNLLSADSYAIAACHAPIHGEEYSLL